MSLYVVGLLIILTGSIALAFTYGWVAPILGIVVAVGTLVACVGAEVERGA
jgi:hypothetical protein